MRNLVGPHSGRVTTLSRWATSALVVLVAGCADERSGISAAAWLSPPLNLSMLRLTFREGTRAWEARGGDFAPSADFGWPHSPEWATGQAGDIDVGFELADSTGTGLVAGRITLPLRRDWRWRVDLINATDNPALGCFGCAGSRAYALPPGYRASPSESLWVVWGGNSIRHPVVY